MPLAVRRRLDILISLLMSVFSFVWKVRGREPVNDVVFVEIFKSLKQLLHETFHCPSQA